MDNNLILVLYLGIGNMIEEDVPEYAGRIQKSLFPEEVIKKLGATLFIIPRRDIQTTLDCINPKYVVDKELYESYNEKLKFLVKEMNQFTNNDNAE